VRVVLAALRVAASSLVLCSGCSHTHAFVFANARAITPGKREGRRFKGQYVLNQNDIYPNAVSNQRWQPTPEQKTPPEPTLFWDRVSYSGWDFDLHNPMGMYVLAIHFFSFGASSLRILTYPPSPLLTHVPTHAHPRTITSHDEPVTGMTPTTPRSRQQPCRTCSAPRCGHSSPKTSRTSSSRGASLRSPTSSTARSA
jgi:hypothetical protein